MPQSNNQADYLNLGRIGWKYYNTIRKKAVEQEFSWSGLFISLSIAFFVVILSASGLSLVNRSIETGRERQNLLNKKIYYLEKMVQPSLALARELKFINLYNRG